LYEGAGSGGESVRGGTRRGGPRQHFAAGDGRDGRFGGHGARCGGGARRQASGEAQK
jgi:hypothetical protein